MKEPILYKIVRPIIRIGMRILFRPTYIGLENIPKEGRFVLGGNHTNNFDCLLLMSSTKRVIHFLAKDSLTKGFKKIIFNKLGIIPVNRSIHDKAALNRAIRYLEEEKGIGIFPEGTINRGEKPTLPFKIGCVKMAREKEAPIIPFIIKGKYKIFHNCLTIKFLKPFKVKQDLTTENVLFMQTITEELIEKRR